MSEEKIKDINNLISELLNDTITKFFSGKQKNALLLISEALEFYRDHLEEENISCDLVDLYDSLKF